MHVARALIAAERDADLLELDRLPEHEPRPHHEDHREHREDIKELLHGVAGAKPVVEAAAEEICDVGEDLTRPDRRKILSKVARDNSVDDVDRQTDEQEPHRGEVPEQGAGKSDVVVHAFGAFWAAEADRTAARESETE